MENFTNSEGDVAGNGTFVKSEREFFAGRLSGRVAFLNFALYTHNETATPSVDLIESFELFNESSSSSTSYILRFPGYFKDIIYDPDFGVVLAPSSGHPHKQKNKQNKQTKTNKDKHTNKKRTFY